jgi:transglutaminase-like putative cysteine protease
MTDSKLGSTDQDKTEVNNRILPVFSLLLIIVLQLVSHVSHLPFWLSGFVILACLYRYVSYKRHGLPVSATVRNVLIISSTVLFFAHYKMNFTVAMAASFLFLTSSLKFIEIRNNKDTVIAVYTMLYLSAVSFLFNQSIPHALVQFVSIIICFQVLLRLNLGLTTKFDFAVYKGQVKALLKVFTLSIPLVLICFIFFPRISPLWSMPFKVDQAKSGISDTMSPGDIASLTKSSEIAFRVKFSGSKPDKQDLYWRGLVLDHFDGKTWHQGGYGLPYEGLYKVDPGTFYNPIGDSYRVMLSPHQNRWVFALEGSTLASSNVLLSDMGAFNLKTDAVQATHYQMSYDSDSHGSGRHYGVPTLYPVSGMNRNSSPSSQDLQLPPRNKNLRTREYIAEVKSRFRTPEKILTYLLTSFSENDYFYTLKPPVLGDDFVDEFMFDSRQGFCAHYAGSLAYMLRLAGMPARVILGYQGGELNDASSYMIVHQYDAHAWVEVQLPLVGWVRVDPTAMVSPERILDGVDQTFDQQDGFLENSLFTSAALQSKTLNWLRMRLDEIDYQWQKMVVNYNQDEQYSLVESILGEYSLLKIALVFVYSFGCIILLIIAYSWWNVSPYKYTRAQINYMIGLFILSRLGLKRQIGETPNAFLRRVQRSSKPMLVKFTQRITLKMESKEYSGSEAKRRGKRGGI